jgi:hypothetical protein
VGVPLPFIDRFDGTLDGAALAKLTALESLNIHPAVWDCTYGPHFGELHGTIPTELGQLKELSDLTITYQSLTGTIPSQLAQLPKLSNLDLSANQLTGLVPPLPFAQYKYNKTHGTCNLVEKTPFSSIHRNQFRCPLPAHADKCTTYDGSAGVTCS